MSLDTGGPINFKPRPVEGAPAEARSVTPQSLLLDGQQRMTSLYQVTLRGKVVDDRNAEEEESEALVLHRYPQTHKSTELVGLLFQPRGQPKM
jgi:hypothetical protein